MSKRLGAIVAMMVSLVAGSLVAAQPASAGEAGTLGCQVSTFFTLYRADTQNTWERNCSGAYAPNLFIRRYEPRGWSGSLIINGVTVKFCNYQSRNISGYVSLVVLSATKAPWCS
jgi:hypothetical protein